MRLAAREVAANPALVSCGGCEDLLRSSSYLFLFIEVFWIRVGGFHRSLATRFDGNKAREQLVPQAKVEKNMVD